VGKDEWTQSDLYAWLEAAEGGFEDSFSLLGPGATTEEQIAYAYWYGGRRMRDIPAYSLEDFIYEKTDRIETTNYGIETRFWFAGKEIPDIDAFEGNQLPPDLTVVEDVLCRYGIPVSEYVIQSYVRDALYRNDDNIPHLLERIAPPNIHLDERSWKILVDYVVDTLEEFKVSYTLFADQSMGPIRQRVGELHTAVVELFARLKKSGLDSSWLPKHTYIVLSQIQNHTACVLEDLDSDEEPPEADIEAMDNSLDSMIETYEDIKELIEEALTSFRRNNLSVVRPRKDGQSNPWRMIQVSLGGLDVWRRVTAPEFFTFEDLHHIIQIVLNWNGSLPYRFSVEKSPDGITGIGVQDDHTKLKELCASGISEFLYEYGLYWNVKVILMPRYEGGEDETVRCVAGERAAPPEEIEGPLRFRRLLMALERGGEQERKEARRELGHDFNPGSFDLESCNRSLSSGKFKHKVINP
jgi:hypothetical protein